ncbi:MAG: DsbC family protein [Zetaproteobacteria bacterium]|nr:MAG: DsbC family protein [Zetaproteobacteria bacterium]
MPRRISFFLFMLLAPTLVFGEPMDSAVEQAIRQAIPQLNITAVRPAPMEGLYEVQAGSNIYYADKNGRHLIVGGHIIDTQAQRDLTQERIEDITRIDWKRLPLDLAIVSGDPKAPHKLAVFTDPDCPYCKRLEALLKDLKGVRVYTFLYPLTQLHPDAWRKAQAIWCSKDRHDTLVKTMLEGIDPGHATCAHPLDRIGKLGDELGISGTPTLIAGDGRRMAGAPRSVEDLKAWILRQ